MQANKLYLELYLKRGLAHYHDTSASGQCVGPVYVHPTATVHPTAKVRRAAGRAGVPRGAFRRLGPT